MYRIRKDTEVYPVYSLDMKKFLKKKFKNCYIECEDNKYYTCGYKKAKEIVPLIPLKLIKYKKEAFDCDDYSRLYWSAAKLLFPRLPIGRCNVSTSKGKHSLNFIVYQTGNRLSWSYIEPQEGKMSYWNYKPYLIIV